MEESERERERRRDGGMEAEMVSGEGDKGERTKTKS